MERKVVSVTVKSNMSEEERLELKDIDYDNSIGLIFPDGSYEFRFRNIKEDEMKLPFQDLFNHYIDCIGILKNYQYDIDFDKYSHIFSLGEYLATLNIITVQMTVGDHIILYCPDTLNENNYGTLIGMCNYGNNRDKIYSFDFGDYSFEEAIGILNKMVMKEEVVSRK